MLRNSAFMFFINPNIGFRVWCGFAESLKENTIGRSCLNQTVALFFCFCFCFVFFPPLNAHAVSYSSITTLLSLTVAASFF